VNRVNRVNRVNATFSLEIRPADYFCAENTCAYLNPKP